jgi:hypothetical protein
MHKLKLTQNLMFNEYLQFTSIIVALMHALYFITISHDKSLIVMFIALGVSLMFTKNPVLISVFSVLSGYFMCGIVKLFPELDKQKLFRNVYFNESYVNALEDEDDEDEDDEYEDDEDEDEDEDEGDEDEGMEQFVDDEKKKKNEFM